MRPAAGSPGTRGGDAVTDRPGKRRDVQGLRAVAVLAVVADHTLHAPRGGFVGVDVFFVISGFLITGLLLREHGRTGTISIVGFTRHRIRRILPAAVLVLAVTAAATALVLGPARWDAVRWDALAAAVLVANWHFAATGTDYFQADGPTSPLQHFWSLSVEEQFYLVWPWVLLGVLTLAARRRRGVGTGRTAVPAAVAVAVLGAASVAWSAYETAASPTVAYFSTPSRAWELLLGAGLAVVAPALEHLPTAVRHVLAWAGLAAIATALALTDADRGFPMPGAVLPVLGAVAVLAAGIGRDRRRWAPLTDRVSGSLGDLSYSIYLWHFPVVVVFGPYLLFVLGEDRPDVRWVAGVLALTAVTSVLGYHLVERPVLRSAWLADRAASRRRRRPSRLVWSATAIAITGAVVLSAVTLNGAQGAVDVRTDGAGAAAADGGSSGTASGGSSGAQAALSRAITAALRARSWPADLTPSVSRAADETMPGNTARCGSAAWLPAADCTFGDPAAPHHAVLVGDSIAQAYVPALAAILGTGDWSLRITSMYACPFIDREVGNVAKQTAICADRRAKEVQVVRDTEPDLVVVANTVVRGADRSTGSMTSAAAWNEAFRAELEQILPAADHVVVLAPPPPDKDIEDCYSNFAGPSACVSSVSASSWLSMASDQIVLMKALHGSFVDTRPWFCDDDGACPAFVGNLLVKKDQAHPTAAYVEHLTPVIRAALEHAGVLETPASSSPSPSATTAGASTPAPGDDTRDAEPGNATPGVNARDPRATDVRSGRGGALRRSYRPAMTTTGTAPHRLLPRGADPGADLGADPGAHHGPDADRRLRVLHVLDAFTAGGAQRVALDLAAWTGRRGVESAFVGRPGPLVDRVPPSADVHVVTGAGPLAELLDIRRAVASVRPDVVHAHQRRGALLARIAVAGTGAHVVEHAHTCLPRARMRHLSFRSERVFAVSEQVRRMVLDLGTPADRVTIVGNVPSALVDAPVRPWDVHAPLRVLGVGRLTEQKGPRRFVRVVAALARHRPVRATWLGTGPLRDDVVWLAQVLGAPVAFPGAVDDVTAALDASDVLLMTSAWEGLPLVVLEAFARRRPVVATAAVGSPGVLDDGRAVVVPDDADDETVAHRVLAAIDDPAEIHRTLAAAARHLDTAARPEQVFGPVLSAYRALAGAGDRR
ncbi:hypothetical protein DEI86_07060 [Curtobacterium sp. MCBD17_028]|nr:hypothetical protein DEI86_07060 [Curtobacterium sp. MCBD17_028]